MAEALLVIDMQNDLAQAANLSRTIRNINQAVTTFRQRQAAIIWIQHSDAWLTVGSVAWQLMPQMDAKASDTYFGKHEPDSFFETGLDDFLKHHHIDQLTICGAQTELCVDTTIRVGFHLGYQLRVLKNGVTTVDTPELTADQINAHHLRIWDTRFAELIDQA
jgi:nicotinamidase-related amidase